ncbi:MAG TPA: hypothetical protein VFI25_03160 [Planctomycetota bacterium]|jgi:hypothetical protein|nr:hypothetical protein [Planctomycetota bacterium]
MEREQTPRDPGAAPPQGAKPEDPGREAKSPPQKRKSGDRVRPPGDPYSQERLHGQWGDLPEKEQEFLLNPASGELPVRYRRYIVDFLKKGNRTPERR